MEELNLEASPALVVNSDDWSAVNGERGMRTLLSQAPEVDAVFASSDQIALAPWDCASIGPASAARSGIVGFDNTPEAAFFWPPLTTIYQTGRCWPYRGKNLHE